MNGHADHATTRDGFSALYGFIDTALLLMI